MTAAIASSRSIPSDAEPHEPVTKAARASRERAVRVAAPPRRAPRLDRPEPVVAITETGRGDRIADEAAASGRGVEREPDQLVGDVHAVGDQLDCDAVGRERGAGEPRSAPADRRHRVEQVRDRARTGPEARCGLVRARVAVPERHHDAAPHAELDQLAGAGQLGRERQHADGARVEQPLEQRTIGCAEVLERVDTRPLA